MSVPLLLAHLIHSNSANAAPVANLTALHTKIAPAWVSDPGGRGTWSLLYSCVFTLVLCVYSAIHLNVPPPDDTRWRFCLRKAEWVAMAIFTPEIVVVAAFAQWIMARKLLKDLRKIASECQDEEFKRWYTADGSKPSFDMVYAYYAVMGGFAADVEEIHNVLKRVTITIDGLIFLANQGFFCRVTRSDIDDKSKADLLAKGLVVVQVLWVAGQAIERKLAGFPITLLEIHTLVHVACALIMYALWLQKPLNIQDPTIIDFRDRPELLASMLQLLTWKLPSGFICTRGNRDSRQDPEMVIFLDQEPLCLKIDAEQIPAETLDKIKTRPEISNLHGSDSQRPIPIVDLLYTLCVDPNGEVRKFANGRIGTTFLPASRDQIVCTLYSGQVLNLSVKIGPSLPALWSPCWSCDPSDFRSESLGHPIESVSFTRKDIRRLDMVGKWVQNMGETFQNRMAAESETKLFNLCRHIANLRSYYHVAFGHSDKSNLDNFLHLNSPNWEGILLETDNRNGALALLPIAYGCIHLTALHVGFPNTVERLLWKISCYFLIGMPMGVAIYLYILISSRHRKLHLRENSGRACESETAAHVAKGLSVAYILKPLLPLWNLLVLIPGALLYLGCFLYIGARLFLVVESFISLRHVPIGVYQTPRGNFMSYVPHL